VPGAFANTTTKIRGMGRQDYPDPSALYARRPPADGLAPTPPAANCGGMSKLLPLSKHRLSSAGSTGRKDTSQPVGQNPL